MLKAFVPRKYLYILFFWFLALLLTAYIGLQIVPHTGVNANLKTLEHWSNWDGNNYVSIATVGYEETGKFSYAFFPLYPLLIHLGSFLIPYPFLVAWLISITAFTITILLIHKLMRLDFSEKTTSVTILLFLLFPTSFFFFATYTESLFLCFVVASIYYFRRKQILISTLCAAGACATRTVGMTLVLFFLWELWERRKSFRLRNVLPIVGSCLGLGSYMVYVYLVKHDALYFQTIQKTEFYRSQLVLPFNTLLHTMRFWYVYNINPFDTWFGGITFGDIVAGWVFFALILIGFFLKIRKSYLMYALGAWSVPLMTGNPASMLRFVVVLFPCFIVLALLLEHRPILRYIWYGLSAIGLILATMYFHTGHWIG